MTHVKEDCSCFKTDQKDLLIFCGLQLDKKKHLTFLNVMDFTIKSLASIKSIEFYIIKLNLQHCCATNWTSDWAVL